MIEGMEVEVHIMNLQYEMIAGLLQSVGMFAKF